MGMLNRDRDPPLPELCRRALAGSQWSALLVAIHTKPMSLAELLRTVGVPLGKLNPAFDAVADAYSMYLDARARGAGF